MVVKLVPQRVIAVVMDLLLDLDLDQDLVRVATSPNDLLPIHSRMSCV